MVRTKGPIKEVHSQKSLRRTVPSRSQEESGQALQKPSKPTPYIIEPTSQWFSALIPISPTSSGHLAADTLAAKLTHASDLLAQAVERYASDSPHTTSTSDATFLQRVLTSGTLSDRLSALTLMVQASPVHNCRALESLKAMSSKKGRDESLKALRAIVDWWVGGGAPNRKLRFFRDQPLTHPDASDQHLVLWYFEDWLKKYFFSILQLLEALSLDPLPYVRTQALSLIAQLLREKPEQEQNLLRLLVNKLGDSDRTVAAKASYYLLQILQSHPQMKGIIVREVSALVMKPADQREAESGGINAHARYYAVITFNQIVLGPSDQAVARRLVEIYFELFKGIIGESQDEPGVVGQGGEEKKKSKKGTTKKPMAGGFVEVEDASSKIISAILTGVNRALPFAKADDIIFDKHIDNLFRITHSATFNISIQALVLILQVCSFRQTIVDRFYRTLYSSLLDPRLLRSSKQAMYLNLLFKSIKADKNLNRVKAFVKRFIQGLGNHQPSFVCGGLFLLGELFCSTSGLRCMLTEVEEMELIGYDPRKREPEFANAQNSCLWELIPLLSHFHPAVSLHARQLLDGMQLTANADLSLNTLTHFLDRFVYRNPKKPKPRGASAMQPAAYEGSHGVRIYRGGETGDTVNDEKFWKKSQQEVAVDQLFYHKFFTKKLDKQHAKAQKREDSEEEEDGMSEDEDDEAEIWKAMKASGLGDDALVDMDGDSQEDLDDDSQGDPDDDAQEGSDFGVEEDDDLLSLDEEVWGGIGATAGQKRRGGDIGGSQTKRRKLRDLPTFASYEDYAAMIDGAPEDNV